MTRLSRLALALGALALSGCTAAPVLRAPAKPDVKSYLPARPDIGDQRLEAGVEPPDRWWTQFGSPALDALVQRSLAANPGIDAAKAALATARENTDAQRAAFYPQVSASLQPSRQKSADLLSSPLNNPVNPFSMHTALLSISYAPDVFGANAHLVASLVAQTEQQRQELRAARLALAGNVVAAAIQEAGLRGQIQATESMLDEEQAILAITRRQWQLGAVAEAAVAAQETVVEQTRSALPPLRKQLALVRDQLVALAGAYPDRELAETFDLGQLALPHTLPVSLPSQLAERRPDVLAAAAQVKAATAQVGVAHAATLPQFTLSAGMGSVATRLGDLLKPGGGFWSLVGDVTQPLFDGGALRHRQAAAVAAYDQAAAQYRQVALGAFQNMADALTALAQDADAVQSASVAEAAAARSLAIATRQEALGDISHLALLNAQQAHQQSRLALIQAQTGRLADSAALFVALGGGEPDER